MRVKTSITLPKELLKGIDREDSNRSAFIEKATRHYLWALEKKRRDLRDIEIINANAEELNKEAMEFLEFQRWP